MKSEGHQDPPRRSTVKKNTLSNQQLNNFVTKNTAEFFRIINILEDFLKEDPILRDKMEDYLNAQTQIKKLKVVNDAAERGVALMENYNSILTSQENQKQYLLQVVEQNRKELPNSKRQTIVATFCKS